MDPALLGAAARVDADALRSMLREDPKALEKAILLPLSDTPLHMATLAEQTELVTAILGHKPGLAWSRNRDGLTALHIASALGRDDIVGFLLELDPTSLCLIRDNEGRTPLHYAAINGKIEVIKTLVHECPEALALVTARKETCLHLALMNYELDAFQLLLTGINDYRVLNAKDEDGYTVYRLAKRREKKQVLERLAEKEREIARRSSFWKLFRSQCERIGATFSSRVVPIDPHATQVAATLVTTVTFQALVNPPQAIWKEGVKMEYNCQRLLAFSTCPVATYLMFTLSNTVGFFSSSSLLIFFKGRNAFSAVQLSVCCLVCSYLLLLFAMGPDIKLPCVIVGSSYGVIVLEAVWLS